VLSIPPNTSGSNPEYFVNSKKLGFCNPAVNLIVDFLVAVCGNVYPKVILSTLKNEASSI
jgi:hypothetical protein